MVKYQNMIDRELPEMLDQFGYLPQGVYAEVSHFCLRMFSKGVYARANAPPNTFAIIINDGIRSETALTEDQNRVVNRLVARFFMLGHNIKELDEARLLLHASESLEYVGEKLGCKDYCSQAMCCLLKTTSTSRQG